MKGGKVKAAGWFIKEQCSRAGNERPAYQESPGFTRRQRGHRTAAEFAYPEKLFNLFGLFFHGQGDIPVKESDTGEKPGKYYFMAGNSAREGVLEIV